MADSFSLTGANAALHCPASDHRLYGHLPPLTVFSLPSQPPRLSRSSAAVRCCGSSDVNVSSISLPSFGSRMEESVRRTVAENPVVIYSKTWCSYSWEVKALFKRLGVDPVVIELDKLGPQGPQLQRLLERMTGQYTVPNVFIGGKHIGGCTDTVKLHHKGELTKLLSEITIGTMSFQKPRSAAPS